MSARPLLPIVTSLGALLLAAVLSPASAQSLYAIDDAGSLIGFTGPAAGACGYPNGPLLSLFSYAQPGPCPTPGVVPATPSLLGDVAVDRIADSIWVTDGSTLSELDPGSFVLRSFALAPGVVLPGALTGLGCDAANGLLWLTDGTNAAAIAPPAPPGCPGSPAVVVPAFSLPLAGGASATDIDWDPATGTLWTCDTSGNVTNVLSGGGLGPAGTTAIAPPGGCGIGTGLQGIAVDAAAAPGVVYVAAGPTVYRLVAPGGGAATTTFYMSQPCQSVPMVGGPGGVRGLAFAAYPISFGSPSNGFFPIVGADGQASIPNPGFAIQLAGGSGGEVAALFRGFGGALCPAPLFLGATILIAPPFQQLAGVFVLGPSGLATVPAPIPSSAPAGLPVTLQWITVDFATSEVNTTAGLRLTLART